MKQLLFTLLMGVGTINAQTYFNLQGGIAENKDNHKETLTYQVGIRHQISNIGFKASFNQTDGFYHTFDSYTLSTTYQPLEALYLSLGYRHDNGRGWGRNRNGVNLGINGLIPIQDMTKIIVSFDTTISNIVIHNIMIGVQLDFKLSKHGKQRFF